MPHSLALNNRIVRERMVCLNEASTISGEIGSIKAKEELAEPDTQIHRESALSVKKSFPIHNAS